MNKIKYIGIGASAGGLKELQTFLTHLVANPNAVYIIVQHLSSDHKSLLPEILAKSTAIPVIAAQDGMMLERGNIYVMLPNMTLESSANAAIVKETSSSSSPQPSIDTTFSAIAEIGAESSMGIILSGSGTDGTKGIKAINMVNGISIAQLPSEAEYPGMIDSAIESEAIDIILSVKDMNQLIMGIICTKKDDDEITLNAIKILLQTHDQLDLSKYKEKTILRRIIKRMMLLHIKSFSSYVRYMVKNVEEILHLNQNILIGVTKFFREKEAFGVLGSAVELLLEKEPNRDELRIWVAACSTGEEAYSIAITLCELFKKTSSKVTIRIFASDIDENALNIARKSLYSSESLSEIDTDILNKYFVKKETNYSLSKEIREMVVFTNHDLLEDPPFIKMDVITCRNALIYFKASIQQEIFAMFHYALNPKGILFLGISETASHNLHYFSAINTQWKIYQKEHLNNPPKLPKRFYQGVPHKNLQNTSEVQRDVYVNIEQAIVESIYHLFIPACIVVNRYADLIFTKGEIPYLGFSQGFVSLNLYKNLHPSLHLDVRKVLKESALNKEIAISKFVEITDKTGERVFVRVLASPFLYTHDEYVTLLYFQEIRPDEMVFESGNFNLPTESDLISSLEKQLIELKEQFYNLQNELDISSENMQMMNEELQSSNEELQSSNEELETSNEELQASNEELNNAYQSIQALEQKYFMILESTSECILGLDREGKHTFVNSIAAKELGYSVEYLIGRNSHKTWHHTKRDGNHYSETECPVTKVLESGVQIRGEELFFRSDGSAFDVEFISSPIVEKGEITGTVLFFHDITQKKELERSLHYKQETLKRYMDTAEVLVVILDTNGDIEFVNKKGSEILGAKVDKIIGTNWFANHIDMSERAEVEAVFDSIMSDKMDLISTYTNKIITLKGEKRLIYWHNTLLRDEDKKIIGVISTGSDITHDHAIEELLLKSEEKYAVTFSEVNIGMAHVSIDGDLLKVNRYLCAITGYSEDELLRMNYKDITHPDDLKKDAIYIEKILSNEFPSYQIEKRYIKKDGSILWVNLSVALIRDKQKVPQYFVSVIEDVSEVKLITKELREKEEIMIAQSRQAAMGDMIAMIAHQWRQPISTIAMSANNIRADLELEGEVTTDELHKLIDTISGQTSYLSNTINDFRNFFKPDNEKELITLCEIVAGALSVIETSLKNNDINVIFSNNCKSKVLIFKNEMIQVILNLINNAKDAIASNKVKNGIIEISVSEDSDFIELQICDNGLGISDKVIHKLGEPYLSSKGKNGTGLGLYMSITIIKKHLNGTLEWENRDKGACFKLRLPVEKE